jgi:hypothetical protein
MKKIGFIQGFWFVNPRPVNSAENTKATKGEGFSRFLKIDRRVI